MTELAPQSTAAERTPRDGIRAEPTPPRPDVSVVVPNWNGGPFLAALADSLARDGCPLRREIILVDNASDDGSAEAAERLIPGLRVLRLPENRGFAAACNAGAAAAGAPFVAFLNNDTEWERDWLGPCLACLSAHPAAAFAAPAVIRAGDGQARLDSAGDCLNLRLMPLHRGEGLPYPGAAATDADIWLASGTAVVVRRDFFRDLGGFDEDFFMYYEDTDFFFRALLAGRHGRLCGGAALRHREGGSIRRFESRPDNRQRRLTKTRLMLRNRIWMLARDCPLPYLLLGLPLLLFEALRTALYHLRRGEGATFWRAHADALRGLPRQLAKRRAVQAGRRIGLAGFLRVLRRSGRV